jgi:plastocyanin
MSGPATKTYTAPALPAGKYYFQCDVHGPAMSGTLIIGNAGG